MILTLHTVDRRSLTIRRLSGYQVYINAVSAVDKKAVLKSTSQVITFTCASGCLHNVTSLYL